VLFETVWTGPQRLLVDGCGGVAADVGVMVSQGMIGSLMFENSKDAGRDFSREFHMASAV